MIWVMCGFWLLVGVTFLLFLVCGVVKGIWDLLFPPATKYYVVPEPAPADDYLVK